ncbi:MAG: ABC transporter permease [Oceanospirillales bacterium TMED33]|nr:ABC transporter permease [Gammaproteobacteria bacterium]RPG21774.1 MAG: ABC transporter permease [Oceanospirillales bacterium TMED33]CAI8356625.1 MAG: Inner membrane ABC transporter permease protein YdcV [Gammaproteobacteria bacterium]
MFSKTQTVWLTIFFGCFVVFLYGPVLSIILLAFQGPEGGLTFPMRGVSLHWFEELWRGLGVVDISRALRRSLLLGVLVMIFTVVLSLCAGLAFRKKFRGSGLLFYLTIASLIIPSIAISLGIALQFRLLDETIKWLGQTLDIQWIVNDFQTSMGLIASGLGTHLTWTLPFGLLIMFAVFNRFNPSYEEAARDLGATPWQTFWGVVFPLIAPALVGVALFGFTLSYDELARSSQALGAVNTLPLELRGLTTTVTNPSIYALGAVTTGVSFLVIGLSLALFWVLRRKTGTGQ